MEEERDDEGEIQSVVDGESQKLPTYDDQGLSCRMRMGGEKL